MELIRIQLDLLENILAAMQRGKAIMPYEWMFDVENVRSALLKAYQSKAQALGHPGSLDASIPELSSLCEAILRLSSLSFLGGFGVTFNVVVNTVREAVRNIEQQLQAEQVVT